MLLLRPMETLQQPTSWREGRRLRAWELHQQGWKQKDIATALGITPGAVSQWMARGRAGGVAALHKRTSPGGAIWTRARVAAVIKRAFGVAYHPDHVGRLLRALGWSVQKPLERATQRNEQAIAAWREQKWPAIKKKPSEKGAHSSG